MCLSGFLCFNGVCGFLHVYNILIATCFKFTFLLSSYIKPMFSC
jgi:hypothetical protein